MRKTTRLMDLLHAPEITRLVGAHSPLSARIAAECGYDAIWASGLEISAVAGVPDANILTMSQVLEASEKVALAVDVPVLADCDSGFGDIGNVAHMVRCYERAGIAGVCIEDKPFPKLNSFVDAGGGGQRLSSVTDFVQKIIAATRARSDSDFVVVARIEALICGAGMDEAVTRANAYEAAGADALVIHSKKSTPVEVFEFRRRYTGVLPVVVIPTTYHATRGRELQDQGFAATIYANHALRGCIAAMRDVLAQILADDRTSGVDSRIASVDQVFQLQGMGAMLAENAIVEELAAGLAAVDQRA